MASLKPLGPNDEPQDSGAVVAVHYGDYRRQEIWVSSGANTGNWYPLGGEFGRPRVWIDERSGLQKFHDRASGAPQPRPGPGEVPLHPHWEDVLTRGPVVLLTPGDRQAYETGWRNGRKDMWDRMEDLIYDTPDDEGTSGDDDE